jgi:hypothetical protein
MLVNTPSYRRDRTAAERRSAAQVLDALLPPSVEGLAILAGAGISIEPPSNLLAGGWFMEVVLRRVMPPEVTRDLARSLISVPPSRHFRPGEYVRFETLMMELAQSGIDPDLHVLDCLDACEHPNPNHYLCAELIRRGALVMTTNFDRLIEMAYRRTAKSDDRPLRVIHEDADFPEPGSLGDGAPTLWKLHGSLSVDGRSTRASLQATIIQVLWPGLTRRKQAFVRAVLAARDLVVLGYSGSDDLDLVPLLADTPSARAIVWIDHAPPGAPTFCRTAVEICAGQKALTQYEVVGRDRVFFIRGHPSDSPSAHPDRVVLISTPTAGVVEFLRDCYDDGPDWPAVTARYEFGAEHPDAVERYFDAWIAARAPRLASRYEFALHLLANRSVRSDVANVRRRLAKVRSSLLAGRNATPGEQLARFLERFNTRDHSRASRDDDRELFEAVRALLPRLPSELHGTAHRLEACALWNHERRPEAEALFRRAWNLDRQLGQLGQELATLTTWQQATNSTRDHLSFDDHRAANEIARLTGDAIFPDEAFRRLQELADQTGYKPNLWSHLLSAQSLGYVEEDPERKARMYEEARAMVRAAVDLGDVRGEAQARLLLALCLQETDDREEAAGHLICLLELGRVFDLGETGARARALLGQLSVGDFVGRFRNAFAASLWV